MPSSFWPSGSGSNAPPGVRRTISVTPSDEKPSSFALIVWSEPFGTEVSPGCT